MKITRKCGHVEEVVLTQQPDKVRSHIRRLCGTACSACKRKRHLELARKRNLPKLHGSPRELDWALDIRATWYRRLMRQRKKLWDGFMANLKTSASAHGLSASDVVLRATSYKQQLNMAVAKIVKSAFKGKSARVWIQSQDKQPDWEIKISTAINTQNESND